MSWRPTFVLICDRCADTFLLDATLPDTLGALRARAAIEGWTHIHIGRRDYCPTCTAARAAQKRAGAA